MSHLFSNLEKIAIERLKEFEDCALKKRVQGYYLAYSGGKDSDVILDLARRSGVKFTGHYHTTTCDPPELIRHVIEQSDVKFEKPEITMWQLIRKKGMAPRRNCRFCCEILKERVKNVNSNAIIVTGVRWQESSHRKQRRMFETCFRNNQKQFLNLIIDWTTTDVWNYIKQRNLKYCPLYDEGFKRIGCVLCPMSRETQRDIQRWPKIAQLWERAVKATFKQGISSFGTADELWQWWLNRDSHKKTDKEQLMFFTD